MSYPVGAIVTWSTVNAPDGWLVCDGTGYDAEEYADLFDVIGYTYGGADGTFNVPDLRQRFILGGGWNDPEYAFNDAWATSAFDRSATNGFRCVRAAGPEPNADRIARVIDVPVRDFRAETPVPDAVFEFFVRQFRYDATPLAASIDADDTTAAGRMQTATFAAPSGGERLTAYVFLPEKAKPPYQVVMVFPGSALASRTLTIMSPAGPQTAPISGSFGK